MKKLAKYDKNFIFISKENYEEINKQQQKNQLPKNLGQV